jgi:hypothetical protein
VLNASWLNPALPDDTGSPAPTRDHDFCAICASMTLVGSVILPLPPMVVLAIVPRRVGLIERAIILASTDHHRHFQARGPPIYPIDCGVFSVIDRALTTRFHVMTTAYE